MGARALRRPGAIEQQESTERAVAELGSKATRDLLAGLRAMRDDVSLAEIERALAGGSEDVSILVKASPIALATESFRRGANGMLYTGINAGRRASARHVPARIEREAKAAALRAGVTERAASWASKRSAELVTAVSDSVRASIRLVVADGIARGAHPSTMAREIKDVIGLDERRAAALQNFRAAQAKEGISPDVIAERASKYAERLLNERAELIARTETFRSVNEGRADLWRELGEQGVVDTGKLVREWVTSRDERVDDICEELDGEQAGIDEDFPGGYSAPPDPHPGCRCTVVIREAT